MNGGGSRTTRKRGGETRDGEHKPSACRLINDSTRQLRRRLEKIIPLPSFVSETFTSPNFSVFLLPSILSSPLPHSLSYLILSYLSRLARCPVWLLNDASNMRFISIRLIYYIIYIYMYIFVWAIHTWICCLKEDLKIISLNINVIKLL